MAQLNDDLDTIKSARDSMKTALASKGQTVTKDIRTYAEAIGNISTGTDSPIKLYNSREQMMADITEPDNEYGVVYMSRQQEAQEGDTVSSITCPANVTLDTAISSSSSWYDSAYDLSIQLNATSCTIRYYGNSGSTTASYTSSDGVHYTNSSGEVSMEFDEAITLSSSRTWVDAFSKFLIVGGMYFEGMYEYVDEVDDEWYDMITGYNIDVSNATCSTINQEVYLPELTTLLELMQTDGIKNMIVLKVNNNYYVQILQSEYYMTCDVSNNNLIYHGHFYKHASLGDDLTTPPKYTVYSLDLEHQTYTLVGEFNYDIRCSYTADTNSVWAALPYLNGNILYKSTKNTTKYMDKYDNGTITTHYFNLDDFWYSHVSFKTWHHVKTEFNLEFANQIAEGVTALGKRGPVTGDGTVFNTINWVDFLSQYRSNVDVLTLPSNLNGYHAERLSTPTAETIMLGGCDTRVLHNLPITSNGSIYITEHYIFHVTNNSGTYTTKIYNFAGALVYTAANEQITKMIELTDTIIGYIDSSYASASGIYTFVGKQINLTTSEETTVFTYTLNTASVWQFLTKDNSNNLVGMIVVQSSSKGRVYTMTSTNMYTSDEFAFVRYTTGGTDDYTFDTTVFNDTNYYYLALNQTVGNTHNNLSVVVLNKSTFSLAGLINPGLGNGALIIADDFSKVYASFNLELYELNGTTYTKVSNLPVKFGGGYVSHAGYIVSDANSNLFLVGCGYIINLSTQAKTNTFDYKYGGHPSTKKGDIALYVYNNKIYILTHILDIHTSSTGDNILLECEKRTLLSGCSEYAILENNAFGHLEIGGSN